MSAATALVALHGAVALFGFAALFGKWIPLSPIDIVFGRTIVAAVALVAVLRWRRDPIGRPRVSLILNGALLALHWIAFFAAVQMASIAIALLGFASFPVFVLLLERALHGRRATRVEWIAVILVAVGLWVLVPDLDWANRNVQGLLWGIGAGFTFALLALRNRRWVAEIGAMQLALWQSASASICLLPLIALTAQMTAPTINDILLILSLGLFCTALAHTLFIASMLRLSAHTASVVSILEPVYGIAWAALLLGERPNLQTLIGGVLIVIAAALASTPSRMP